MQAEGDTFSGQCVFDAFLMGNVLKHDLVRFIFVSVRNSWEAAARLKMGEKGGDFTALDN